MKKALLIIGFGLLALGLVIYLTLAFFLGGIVKAGVNNFGPKLTQTKVELAGAVLSPLSGTGTLTGLAVGNPAGWSDGNAFYLGKVHVDVQPFSVLGDRVVINEITIDQPEFNYETRILSSNIKDLLANIEKFSGSGGKEPTTKSGQPIRFIVKKFRLTNGKATVGIGPTALPVPLPPISLDDLGVAEGGITADQLATAIMRRVLSTVAASTAQAIGEQGGSATLEKAKEAVRQLGDGVKDLFKKKP